MVGPRYWSTGISIRWHADNDEWSVSLEFKDDGFCEEASTEGKLTLRYRVSDLSTAIDTLKADAERLGIVWNTAVPACPTIYVEDDGEWEDRDYPPGWRGVVNAQAARLGWFPCYREPATA
jgi:hypothetical protein